jgi:hypothetical protein
LSSVEKSLLSQGVASGSLVRYIFSSAYIPGWGVPLSAIDRFYAKVARGEMLHFNFSTEPSFGIKVFNFGMCIASSGQNSFENAMHIYPTIKY